MKTVSQHSGRIEVKPAQQHISNLAHVVRQLYGQACAYDGIDAGASFAVFSEANPYVPFYDNAFQEYQDTKREYAAGGYVGLRIA
jgi:hypothetical protein